jgi:hypothetical protein
MARAIFLTLTGLSFLGILILGMKRRPVPQGDAAAAITDRRLRALMLALLAAAVLFFILARL